MNTPWRIEMFGGMRAQSGDLTLTRFRTQKTALLLARLAFFPRRTHPREELADALWPDADRDAGRNNLKQSLAILRRLLEPPGTPASGVLIADRAGVRLNPAAITTDVADFEAALRDAARLPDASARAQCLRQAGALYQGELLPGFYDDWVVEERERLDAAWDGAQKQIRGSVPAPTLSAPVPTAAPLSVAPRLLMTFTRFFGREQERTDLAALLGDESVRLVTLTGAGGAGKTRLALEAAGRAATQLDGRAYFVPLADLTDPRLVPSAVADALGLPRAPTGEPMDRVIAALCAAPALLVLDNLEQLGEGAAAPVLALLTRASSLTILATSRTRLFVAGEREYAVAPLPTPEAQAGQGQLPPSPETLLLFPSVQLFADRARAARPDFQVTPRNAQAVADVCRSLEGIPLALELAAAWSSLLTPAQMRERMGDRFTLLRSRHKDITERHQTLQAAIAWSYDLLPPDLARFWARLSVFRGGWTAAAARDVCEEPDALNHLGQLRARSLVTAEESGDEMRFRLLESLREYAEAQLTAQERDDLAGCHAAHFLRLAQQAEPQFTGPDQVLWLDRLAAERDNLRAVMDWSDASGSGHGPSLAATLWRFWAVRGPLSEGRGRLERAAARLDAQGCGSTEAQARTLSGLAVLTRRLGDMAEAGDLQRRSLAAWRVVGDDRGVASSLNNLGALAALQGDYAQSEALLLEALALWRKLGKDIAVASTLTNLAFLERERGDFEAAEGYCEESLHLARAQGDRRGAALTLSIRAEIAAETGEHARAHSLYADVFPVAAEVGDTQTISDGLAVLGRAALSRGLPERAARLLGAARALNDATGFQEKSRALVAMDRAVEDARRALPPSLFAAAWAEGGAMTAEEAVACALEEPGAGSVGQ